MTALLPSLYMLNLPAKTRGWMILLLPVLCSCAPQEICDSQSGSELVARLKTRTGNVVSDTIVPGLTAYGIRRGLSDSLLLDSVPLSRLVLPLDQGSNSSWFVLRINAVSDTLRIHHRNEPYLISYACGFATRFTLDSVGTGSGWISDVEIVSTTVDAETEQDEEHLWIYL